MALELTDPLYRLIGEEADKMGVDAYAVGGVVRDLLLGRPCSDIDVVCVNRADNETTKSEVSIGIQLANRVATRTKSTPVSVFKHFGTAHFRLKDENKELEFVGARKESYRHNSRKPAVENGTLEDDQCRRDFTINALAIALNESNYGELIDPFGGILDLDKGILRTPLDADITFSDDPLRMMRAIRFATQLGFRIDDTTFEAIGRNAERIKIVSSERIVAEINKIMLSPTPSIGWKLMSKSGLLTLILPEIEALKGIETIDGKGHKDIFYHTMEVLDNVARATNDGDKKLWLRWTALFHDVGKPLVKRFVQGQGWTFHGHEAKGSHIIKHIFARLRMPMGAERKYVEKLVMLHMRPIILAEDEVTDSAVRRLLFEAGDDIDDLMLLCNADITSKNEAKVQRYRSNFELVKQKLVELEERDRIRNFQPPVSGGDIMQTFGLGPCEQVGIIKDTIKDAILDGKIANDREQAWTMMLEIGKSIGLTPIKE